MNAHKLSGYICNYCDQLHDDENKAEACCAYVSFFDGYECVCCGERFEYKSDADECCDPETTVKGYMFVLEAKELSGQLRLPNIN